MVSAKGVHRTEGFPYALDNGAWWAFANKQPFDDAAFLLAYERFGEDADFVVLPDIVAGGLKSLEFSLRWRERLPRVCPQLLAVQDGMEPEDVSLIVGRDLGIFVGGSTEWKIGRLADWGSVACDRGAYLHVGRVNSVRRIKLCAAAGVDSFDGSSASRYAVTLFKLDTALHQPDLWAP